MILSEKDLPCHPEPVLWAKDPRGSFFSGRHDELPGSFGPNELGLRMTAPYGGATSAAAPKMYKLQPHGSAVGYMTSPAARAEGGGVEP
jgi:hypothetical protein